MAVIWCVTSPPLPPKKKFRTTLNQDHTSCSYSPFLLAIISQNEVKCWLAIFFPRLQEGFVVHYQVQLLANSYECRRRMMCVQEEDLHFMISVHRRAMVANVKSIPVEGLDASNK